MDDTNKACVLLLNLPTSALGGIDLLSFQTTPRFHGIKNLPPGWHFVFASTNSSLSVRHGAWFRVKGGSGPPELFIKKWDAAKEELVEEQDETEKLRWRANLGSIWREGLTPYRQSASKDVEVEEKHDWRLLTDRISDALLDRIIGSTPDHWSLTSASSAKRDMDEIPGLSNDDYDLYDKELNFLPIELKQTWRVGATGRERTEAAQDRSWALGDLIEHHCTGGDEMEVLGELQFTFLMVLTLNNYSCLEQWKRILQLLFTCKAAVTQRPELFIHTLATLRLQLQHCQDVEGGLFDLSDDGATLLKGLLRSFKKGLQELSGKEKADVMDELDELESYLKSEHGWDLDDSVVRRGMLELEDGERVEMDMGGYDEDDETGEYAPMVVELTEAQTRALGGEGVERDEAVSAHSAVRKLGKNVEDNAEHEEEEEEQQDLEDMDARY